MDLSVREMTEVDIPLIVAYWLHSDPAHLTAMGVDLEKRPSEEVLTSVLSEQLQLPTSQKRSYCLIWEEDGQPIGHCNTNPTFYGEEAFMHLHIWNAAARKKGAGLRLLKMSLPLFFDRLKIERLYSEPFALNPAPNHTLENAGFILEKEYITVPGTINFEQPVKRWMMTRDRLTALFDPGEEKQPQKKAGHS